MAVVVEHGTFGARAAAPIAKDVMTFLFDPATAITRLHELEKAWGGKPDERLNAKYQAYVSKFGTSAPKVGDDEAVKDAIEKAEAPQPEPQTVANPPATTRPEEPASTVVEPLPAPEQAVPAPNSGVTTP
jgi:penicillin-binding protein 2